MYSTKMKNRFRAVAKEEWSSRTAISKNFKKYKKREHGVLIYKICGFLVRVFFMIASAHTAKLFSANANTKSLSSYVILMQYVL